MNKVIITILSIIVLMISILVGIQVFKTQNNNITEHQIAQISEEIEDDCTEEWKELYEQNTMNLQVNTQENIRLSPNCSFTFQTHYTGCGHTSRKYMNIPQQLVNKTEEELQELYNEWKIKTFTTNEVILEKEETGECGEHYVLRDVDGKIVIYVIKDGKEEEYEKTEISTDYLTETDKITMKEGLKVNRKRELKSSNRRF